MCQAVTIKKNIESRMGSGYWISPSGTAIPVKGNHIQTVISAPGKFGLTKQQIE